MKQTTCSLYTATVWNGSAVTSLKCTTVSKCTDDTSSSLGSQTVQSQTDRRTWTAAQHFIKLQTAHRHPSERHYFFRNISRKFLSHWSRLLLTICYSPGSTKKLLITVVLLAVDDPSQRREVRLMC